MMGSSTSYYPAEIPAYSAEVPDFYLGKYEIARKLWTRVMGVGSRAPK